MRPNILFITTDQQRRNTLGCYGNPLIHTPSIDALAAGSLALDRAYCENPICIPSRNTMITGRNSAHHGAALHNTNLRPDEQTLGEVLGAAG